MKLEPIRSDPKRERVLETIGAITETRPVIARLLRGRTRNQLRRNLPAFRNAQHEVTTQTATRQSLVQNRDTHLTKLERLVRHFRNSLTWRTERRNDPPSLLKRYLPMEDAHINLTIPRDVVTYAACLVEGEAWAVRQGYPPMQNPSIDEITAILPDAKAGVLAVELADMNHAEAQEALREVRGVVDVLLRTIAKEVQMELGDKPDACVRRVLRRLGFGFVGSGVAVSSGQTKQETEPLKQHGIGAADPLSMEGETVHWELTTWYPEIQIRRPTTDLRDAQVVLQGLRDSASSGLSSIKENSS